MVMFSSTNRVREIERDGHNTDYRSKYNEHPNRRAVGIGFG
jgi:hypothetical protein